MPTCGDLDQVTLAVDPNSLETLTSDCPISVGQYSQLLEQLEATVKAMELSSTADWSPLSIGALSALIGSFAAFIFSLIQLWLTHRRNDLNAGGEGLLSLVGELEDIAIKYWLIDADSMTAVDRQTQELKIKTLLRLIVRYANGLQSIFLTPAQKRRAVKISEIASKLFDLASGEEFESKSRKTSPPTASSIASQCAEVRGELHQLLHF